MRIKKRWALYLAALLLVGMGAAAASASAEGGSVYYLSFKPEQDPQWQDLAKLYTEQTGVPVTIHVTNGFQIKNAVVKSYDSFVVLIEVDKQQMMIYKHAISTITPAKTIVLRDKKEEK